MGANRLKFLMIVFRLKLFSWQPTEIASLLPCLNSSNEWVQQLRKFAIASSPKLKHPFCDRGLKRLIIT